MLKKSFCVLLVSIIAYNYYQISNVKDSPIVETQNGPVKGKVSISRDGREFYEYLGIPYAKPPIGEFRYESPVEAGNWEGVRTSQVHGAECAQVNFVTGMRTGEEDCLFLNVATPKIGNTAKLPVMVFIHGGLFCTGSSNGYGPNYLIDENVIVVSMNYRLASLGFLNTGDGLIHGNMGLKDQTMALHWVQKNIVPFGGDRNKVTIVGESAGGASVHFHLLSPTAKGTFQRAISQSGTVLNPWAIRKNPGSQARRHATQLGCPTSNSKEMIRCMKSLPVDAILDAHEETTNMFRDVPAIFVPTVETIKEGAVIPAHPYDLIRAGPVSRVPWLTGYNADEGQIFFAFLGKNESGFLNMEQKFAEELPKLLMYDFGNRAHRTDLIEKAVKFYFKESKPAGFGSVDIYNQIFTDGMFSHGISESMKLHSEFHAVFPYYYTYHGEAQIANLMMALKGKYPLILEVLFYMAEKWVNENILGRKALLQGAAHADELMMLFEMKQFGSVIKPGDKDYEMSKNMVKLWTSFVKGEENSSIDGKKLHKLDSNAKEVKYLKLDKKFDTITEPNIERLKFWKANSFLQ